MNTAEKEAQEIVPHHAAAAWMGEELNKLFSPRVVQENEKHSLV